jgi:hypothetical protein
MRIILAILLLVSPAFAEIFGLSSIGGSGSATMTTWTTTYVTRAHRYISNQHTAGSNDVFTQIWLYGDSATAGPSELAGALYGIDTPSGDSAIPDNRLALTDTLAAVANGYRWIRLDAVSDYALTENDTVTIAWEVSQDVNSYYDAGTRGTAMYETDSDPLPSDITPPATQNFVWSVFGCINQEGNGVIDQGHVPTSYTGGTNWTTPENIQGDEGIADLDDACATYDNTTQDVLAATTLDHSLPTSPTPTIDSITVVVQGNCESAAGTKERFEISLSKDGTTAIQWWAGDFTQVQLACGGLEDNLSFTFRGDTLGTWSGAGINDSLYVLLRDEDTNASKLNFDGLSTTVYFTPGSAAGAFPVRRRHEIIKLQGES